MSSSAPTATQWSGWTPISARRWRSDGPQGNIVNATFDTIIPGLAAGKYDMGASSFTDTKAREKVVNFVDYFQAGTSFFTKTSGGTAVTSLADLCGKTVSVESGTTEETDAKAQSVKCKAAGKPAVNVLVFPTQTAANLALSSGRAQVSMADSPVAAYQVKQSHGNFKLVGADLRRRRRTGSPIPKNSTLDKAVLAGAQGADEQRDLRQDLDEVGDPERRDPRLGGQDQRRDELASRQYCALR